MTRGGEVGQQVDLVGEIADPALHPNGNGSLDRLGVTGDPAIEQRLLPLPIHLVRPLGDSEFAHPAELELARIFSFYRIRWVYEPTTFHLEVDDDGRPLEQITPDFYLPDHDIYVELTTMRQKLVTRKNRKIRRLKEAFPLLQVKLLYRKDYDRLIDSFRAGPESLGTATPGKPIFSEKQIEQRIADLACEMVAGEGGNSPRQRGTGSHNGFSVAAYDNGHHGRTIPEVMNHHQLVGLGPGSRRFVEALGNELRSSGFEVQTDWLVLTRFEDAGIDQRVRIARRPRLPVEGKDVTLVADVISTGLSVAFVIQWLERHGANSVRICTLLDREEARILNVPVDHAGFLAPNDVLVGYGISFMSKFDDLPHIAALKSPARHRSRAQRRE
jgi:hypoxanthine phosphoribosyltransferase